MAAALLLLGMSARAQSGNSSPHPSVARIAAHEKGAIAYGSGALVDVRDEYGLVITNWHVVRDATGPIEVIFPSGFKSEARKLKLDEDWDLAALVIWRPPTDPIPIASQAPRPGEPLTICGYGSGQYRSLTGRCTDYYAPAVGMPHEFVELDVEARQGDSGGPILNARGEIAGVLFGAGQGTTLGSFGGRVGMFLASVAPRVSRHRDTPLVASHDPKPEPKPQTTPFASPARANLAQTEAALENDWGGGLARDNGSNRASNSASASVASAEVEGQVVGQRAAGENAPALSDAETAPVVASIESAPSASATYDYPAAQWFDQAKTIFAAIGLIIVVLQLVRLVT